MCEMCEIETSAQFLAVVNSACNTRHSARRSPACAILETV